MCFPVQPAVVQESQGRPLSRICRQSRLEKPAGGVRFPVWHTRAIPRISAQSHKHQFGRSVLCPCRRFRIASAREPVRQFLTPRVWKQARQCVAIAGHTVAASDLLGRRSLARTKIHPVHPQATENTYRINCTSARKTGIVMPVRVGLMCRIVTNLLDLGSSSRAQRWRNGTAEAARNNTESRDATGSSRMSRWRRRQGHGTSITRSA